MSNNPPEEGERKRVALNELQRVVDDAFQAGLTRGEIARMVEQVQRLVKTRRNIINEQSY